MLCGNYNVQDVSGSEYIFDKKTYDYKKLYVALKKYNINIKNVVFDELLAIYLINPSFKRSTAKSFFSLFFSKSLILLL